MVGYLHDTGRWGRLTLTPHQVLGLTVWEAALPKNFSSRRSGKQVEKALSRLETAGCRRLLSPPPAGSPLPGTETGPLWQAMAAPLALAWLEEQHLPERTAVAALAGDRLSPAFLRACRLLAPRVRALSLSLEDREEAEWFLQRELGLPLVQGCGDVTVSFLPGVSRPGFFALGGRAPEPVGYILRLEGLEPPPGCPELPLLAALYRQGRLPLSRVQVLGAGKNAPGDPGA